MRTKDEILDSMDDKSDEMPLYSSNALRPYIRKAMDIYKDQELDGLREDVIDIIDSENSGLGHQARLDEINKLIRK